ncbi:MAG: YHS domain protein [Bacteroidetes bacterium]|nr:YHS domain protein [Bacteroidota bacterium]
MRKSILPITFLLVSFIGASAQKEAIFSSNGKAINGYDPVAFFTQSKPVMGSDSLSYMYMDTRWLFATQADLDAFKASPDRYTPQYGGYCAFGTAQGHKAPTKPETWTIVNDKLYFNYSAKVKEMWMKDQQALIEKADKTWPELKDKP